MRYIGVPAGNQYVGVKTADDPDSLATNGEDFFQLTVDELPSSGL